STIAWRNHSMPRSKSSGPIVPSTRRGKRPGRILPATSNSGIIGFVSIRLSITGPLKRPTTSTWTGSSQHEIVPIQLSGKREASQAVLVEAHDEWQVSERRYLSEGSMALLATPIPDPKEVATPALLTA